MFDTEKNLYEQMGGENGIRKLVDAFYDYMDQRPEFAAIRQLHANKLTGSRDKLFWFLSGFSGGPNLYVEQFGHPRLRARHLPFKIGITERDLWLACMDLALTEMAYHNELRTKLQQQFFKTADWMRNQIDDSGLVPKP